MHGDHRIPLVFGHVDQHAVTQNASVVHQDVEVAERFDGAVDEALSALPVGDVVAVDHGLSAHCADFGSNFLRRGDIVTGAIVGSAEIVNNDLGAFSGEQQRVLATDATACSGDDCYASVKCSHGYRS